MDSYDLTRRQAGIGIGSAITLALAGCLGDDDDNGDDTDDDFEFGENDHELTIFLENENGDPVSNGVRVTAEDPEGTNPTIIFDREIMEGQAGPVTAYEGEYDITAESIGDEELGIEAGEFDDVTETVTVDDDTEVTLTLDGATSDADLEDEDENDENDNGEDDNDE